MRAHDALKRLPIPPIAELQAALDSSDWQQRQMASGLLWRLLQPEDRRVQRPDIPTWRYESQGEVTQRLLEVTIEGLRHDALPISEDGEFYNFVFNAGYGVRNLARHAVQARPLLEAGLDSDDRQQRLLCAMVLGLGGVAGSAALAAPILLPHLRDNDTPEDAKWAVHALYGFGEAVLPMLREALPDADRQQSELIELLILDVTSPPTSRKELEARAALNSIATSVLDPAVTTPELNVWWLGYLQP